MHYILEPLFCGLTKNEMDFVHTQLEKPKW